MTKKKLLFCAYSLDVGGIEKALINLLDNIDFNKYDVTLILEKKEGIYLNRLSDDINVLEYRVNNCKISIIRKTLNFLKSFLFRIRYHNKFDFSCCYATYSYPCNKLARIASKNSSIYIHSDYTNIYKDEQELRNFFDTRNLDKFKTIIFVSKNSMNNLCSYYKNIKEKSIVINNLINFEEIIKMSKEKIDIVKKLNKKTFVFVGRLEEKSKNISLLIDIIYDLKEQGHNIELFIIGDGPDLKLYEEKIKILKLEKEIKILGNKKNPYPYIKMADYIIFTSNYEGFPVVYSEAIILQKPIITTIDVEDDYISIPNNFGFIISKDRKKINKEITEILNKKFTMKKIDFSLINKEKIKKLETIFEGEKDA